MAEILQLPLSRTDEVNISYYDGSVMERQKTSRETLDILMELALNDYSSFYCLEEKCLRRKTESIPRIENKLFKLHLIDEKGNPTLEVRSIMNSITKKQQKYGCI